MIKVTCTFVTIIDVMKEMNIKPEKGLDWAAGLSFAKWYIRFAELKEAKKYNAPKTFDPTKEHALAHYHEDFRAEMKRHIRMCKFELERQGRFLFIDEMPPQARPSEGVHVDL